MPTYEFVAKWLNDNQGIVAVILFATALMFGWLTGIFSALRRKPKFSFHLIAGPTFCCTYPTGSMKNDYPIHRTGIALYLYVANTGSSASSIERISVGYHCNIQPYSIQWLRFRMGWFWLSDQIAVIHDFQAKIGDNIKIYPFLVQASILSDRSASTFLQPGQATNGVVYFEQSDSWGGFYPSPTQNKVRVKVALFDTFGRRHTRKFNIESVTMDYARTYNPSFGKTIAEMRNETLPHDKAA